MLKYLLFLIAFSYPFTINAQEIEYQTIRSGMSNSLNAPDRIQLVFSSERDLTNFWIDMFLNWFPQPDIPDVDFQERRVIFIAMGRDSLGSRSGIKNLQVVNGKSEITVSYKEIFRGLGCIHTHRRPYEYILIPEKEKPVTFNVKKETKDCFLNAY